MEEIKVQPERIKLSGEYVQLEKLKNLLYLYQCSFSNNGKCTNILPTCCDGCKENSGYLKFIEKENEQIYKDAFGMDGFLDKNKGCKLPRELRSITCNTHFCKAKRATISKELLVGLDELANIMKDLEKTISRIKVKN